METAITILVSGAIGWAVAKWGYGAAFQRRAAEGVVSVVDETAILLTDAIDLYPSGLGDTEQERLRRGRDLRVRAIRWWRRLPPKLRDEQARVQLMALIRDYELAVGFMSRLNRVLRDLAVTHSADATDREVEMAEQNSVRKERARAILDVAEREVGLTGPLEKFLAGPFEPFQRSLRLKDASQEKWPGGGARPES